MNCLHPCKSKLG